LRQRGARAQLGAAVVGRARGRDVFEVGLVVVIDELARIEAGLGFGLGRRLGLGLGLRLGLGLGRRLDDIIVIVIVVDGQTIEERRAALLGRLGLDGRAGGLGGGWMRRRSG